MKAETTLIRARLRAPFVSAWGSIGIRGLVLLELVGADGARGWGEAAPLEGYDGVSSEDIRTALEDCRETLAASDGVAREELLAACAGRAVLPQALAAVDLALWDLAARRAGVPVWRLLGACVAEPPDPVLVNATIAATDRDGAARQAAAALAAGFGTVKVKVGTGDDAGRLAAVRAAAGPRMAIRLDANGTWSVSEATASLRTLAPAGIELCEEPVSGLAAIRQLHEQAIAGRAATRRLPEQPASGPDGRRRVPIAIDETAAQPDALDHRACDAVCLKIARCGGISGLIDAAHRARAVGYEVYLASTLDGPLGIAAALHAAVALRAATRLDPARACGLATLPLFDGRPEVLPVRRGRIALAPGPGLGDGLVEWYGSG
ncbi:MAG: mandelate racemase/muconate lactonizing enzyme family protein [Solirubrobacteraceae bacterium]